MAREAVVEEYLKDRVEDAGGACEKHTNPGHRGDPDRLVSFPRGYKCLVETKWADDAEPEPHQLRRHEWWRDRGMPVHVLRSKAAVNEWMLKMRWAGYCD
jgi:hypothetical protein